MLALFVRDQTARLSIERGKAPVYPILIHQLLESFVPEKSLAASHHDVMTASQNPSESVRDFAMRLQGIAAPLDAIFDDPCLKEKLLFGLRPEMQGMISLRQDLISQDMYFTQLYTSITEIASAVSGISNSSVRIRARNPSPLLMLDQEETRPDENPFPDHEYAEDVYGIAAILQPSVDIRTVICLACRYFGHYASSCPQLDAKVRQQARELRGRQIRNNDGIDPAFEKLSKYRRDPRNQAPTLPPAKQPSLDDQPDEEKNRHRVDRLLTRNGIFTAPPQKNSTGGDNLAN